VKRQVAVQVARRPRGREQDPDFDAKKQRTEPKTYKGSSFQQANRRRGRPAHLRSPDDSPLRDANRDLVLGLLTFRAARTLVVYLQETNIIVSEWLLNYMRENSIPASGAWEDVSGDTFIRKLLTMPLESTKLEVNRDSLYDNRATIGVDPRSIAQRIMDIRTQLADEFMQDLKTVKEDNNTLLRETIAASFNASEAIKKDPAPQQSSAAGGWVHPEMMPSPQSAEVMDRVRDAPDA